MLLLHNSWTDRQWNELLQTTELNWLQWTGYKPLANTSSRYFILCKNIHDGNGKAMLQSNILQVLSHTFTLNHILVSKDNTFIYTLIHASQIFSFFPILDSDCTTNSGEVQKVNIKWTENRCKSLIWKERVWCAHLRLVFEIFKNPKAKNT